MIDSLDGIVIMASDQQEATEFINKNLVDLSLNQIHHLAVALLRIYYGLEVAPKASQSTITLMVPNTMMTSDGVKIEAIKKSIGAET